MNINYSVNKFLLLFCAPAALGIFISHFAFANENLINLNLPKDINVVIDKNHSNLINENSFIAGNSNNFNKFSPKNVPRPISGSVAKLGPGPGPGKGPELENFNIANFANYDLRGQSDSQQICFINTRDINICPDNDASKCSHIGTDMPYNIQIASGQFGNMQCVKLNHNSNDKCLSAPPYNRNDDRKFWIRITPFGASVKPVYLRLAIVTKIVLNDNFKATLNCGDSQHAYVEDGVSWALELSSDGGKTYYPYQTNDSISAKWFNKYGLFVVTADPSSSPVSGTYSYNPDYKNETLYLFDNTPVSASGIITPIDN